MSDLEDTLRRLRREFDSVARDVSTLQSQVGGLESTANRVARDLDEVSDRVEEHDTTLGQHQRSHSKTKQSVDRLAQRLQLLERAVRVSEGVPQIDLDDVPAATRRLATVAAKRHSLGKQILSDHERAQHEQALQRHPSAVNELRSTEIALVQLLQTIATTRRGSVARADAPVRLQQAAATRRNLIDHRIPAAQRVSTNADRALRADDAMRASVLPQLRKAQEAWTSVNTRIRTRITEALGMSALMPMWFTTTLGVAPPRGASGDHWMKVATEVLVYRITYDITDAALPLGASSTDDRWSVHRKAWRAELERELEALDPDA